MYLLSYDYDDSSRDEPFVFGEEEVANARYNEIRNDPYVYADSIVLLTMCVTISFTNSPDAKEYTYRTEQYLGNRKVIEPYDENGNRWVDEHGNPISVYVKIAGYRPAAEAKELAHRYGKERLTPLFVAEDFAAKEKVG